jgi:adenylate cyclase
LLNSSGLTLWKSSIASEEKFMTNWPDVTQKGLAIVTASENQVYIEPIRLSDEFSFLRFYVPLVKDQSGKVSHLIVVDYDTKMIHGLFKESSERTYFVVDSENRVLYHSEGINYMGMNLEKHPMILLARRDNSPSKGQKLFLDPILKEKVYSAFFKTHHNFVLVAQISEALILEPAIAVRRRIFLIGGIVLSVSILVVFWFSLTLSSPIEKLASLMELVKKGIFDIHAFQKTKSFFSDEVTDLALAVDQMTEGLKERDKVKNLFSKFVGSSVTDDLLSREVALGGTRKNVVVFFSDIRGFTAMSEILAPEDVVEMLNEYFQIMVKIINETGGVVDKFIGDAIMAIWGAPNPKSDDPVRAIQACLRMREALNVLNEKRIADGKDPLMIGMGLNMGPAVAGTIGSDERMEYTVIGNTVNTSSRIEAATKAFGTDLLVSEEIYETCKNQFIFELAGEVEVKGRSQALKLYKVKGYIEESGEERIISTPYSEYEAEAADKVKLKTDLA